MVDQKYEGQQRILFLSRWFPYPPDNGSKIRIFHLLRCLASRYSLALISFAEHAPDPKACAFLEELCQFVKVVPYRPFQPNGLKALAGYLSIYPRSVVATDNPQFHHVVESSVQKFRPDLVIASETAMAPYALKVPQVPCILEDLELAVFHQAYLGEKRPIARARKSLTWWKHAWYVRHLLRHFEGCTVVSEAEQALTSTLTPADRPVRVIPNGVDWYNLQDNFGPPVANTMIYAGAMTYSANFDAMDFFLRDIMPIIRTTQPQTRLRITGSYKNVPIEQLSLDENTELTGYVVDIRPVVAQSWVSIVPLRTGGGTRLKILESLALGTPVVTTTKGIEGLAIAPGEGILIADTPQDFAVSVKSILSDPALRATLSERGRRVAQSYNWEQIGCKLSDYIDSVLRLR
jgi:polysaccharide biosynthesis protein PslH